MGDTPESNAELNQQEIVKRLKKEAEEQFRLWRYSNRAGRGNVTGSEGILLDLISDMLSALLNTAPEPDRVSISRECAEAAESALWRTAEKYDRGEDDRHYAAHKEIEQALQQQEQSE